MESLNSDVYYEVVARKYCQLMGIDPDGISRANDDNAPRHQWIDVAREFKREDAKRIARQSVDNGYWL